jgi:putative Holliday junction resolvase
MATSPATFRTLLGFDYGRKRIGVAVGQQLTQSATALTTVSARDGKPDWPAIRYRLPVHPAEERLSSYIVESRLPGSGNTGQTIDPLSAQVILQDWLQQKET